MDGPVRAEVGPVRRQGREPNFIGSQRFGRSVILGDDLIVGRIERIHDDARVQHQRADGRKGDRDKPEFGLIILPRHLALIPYRTR